MIFIINTAHSGQAMNNVTPLQKLKSSNLIINDKVVLFPVMILDNLTFLLQKSGAYIMPHYLIKKINIYDIINNPKMLNPIIIAKKIQEAE